MMLKKCLPLVFCGLAFGQGPLVRDPKGIVAVVDGKNITWGDLQDLMLTAPPDIAAGLQTDPKSALMTWSVIQHLAKEGYEHKLDQQSPTKEQIEAMRMRYVYEARMNEELNGYQPKPEELEKYYQERLNQYQRVRAEGVLIKFKVEPKQGATSTEDLKLLAQALLQGGSVQRTESEALTLANEVAKQWRGGADLKSLVEKYSEDEASKFKNGDLGYITVRSNHSAEVRKMAMAMAPNSISDPIRMPAGFFVIRSVERSAVPLSEVLVDVSQAVRSEHFEKWMNGLRDRYVVEIKDPTIIIQPNKPGAQPAKPAPAK